KDLPKAEVNVSFKSQTESKTLPEKQNNLIHNHAIFHDKALEQYPDLYYEFNSENVDYYGITGEILCPLCKLDHDDEEDIEGKYETGSYYIKCEQREIQITL
ncbi:2825_t:CDS:1, partial [Ambispora gerdemannii]